MNIWVIIPAYNAERYLADTIRSVACQTFEDWRLLVVDDGSTDSTPAIVRQWQDMDSRIRYERKPNGGVASARNFGIGLAPEDADAIALLDHDDLWTPDALSSLVGCLEANPQSPAAYGLASYIDGSGSPLQAQNLDSFQTNRYMVERGRVRRAPDSHPASFELLVFDNCIVTPGQALIRRGALAKTGGFDPDTAPCDDWDMWIRLSRQGPIARTGNTVVKWRIHDTNESKKTDRMDAARHRCYRKTIDCPSNTPEQRRAAAIGYDYWRRPARRYNRLWAREAIRSGRPLAAARLLLRSLRD